MSTEAAAIALQPEWLNRQQSRVFLGSMSEDNFRHLERADSTFPKPRRFGKGPQTDRWYIGALRDWSACQCCLMPIESHETVARERLRRLG